MCKYVQKSKLTEPKEIFQEWVNKVHTELKNDYKLTFQVTPIGSGKRNMVVKKCNSGDFDLDYQIIISKFGSVKFDDAKKIKDIFKEAFDDNKPDEFSCCEDSTQALTTFNESRNFGFDIIITRIDKNDDCLILYNNKNRNGNNNNDYEWQPREELQEYKEKLKQIKDSGWWDELRKVYLQKKHQYSSITDKNDPRYRHSYQLLHEAINEVIDKH